MEAGPVPTGRHAPTILRRRLPDVVGAVTAVVIVLAIGVFRLHFWHIRHPVLFSGDVSVVLEYAKNALQNGATTVDPQIGWPNRASLAAFPVFDVLSAGVLKAISIFTSDVVVGVNVLAYADHVISALIGFCCFRILRIPRAAAVACAVSFTYVEFGLNPGRVFAHETLQLYAPVAIGATIALLPAVRPRIAQSGLAWVGVSAAAALVGCAQPYWVAFSLIVMASSMVGCVAAKHYRGAAFIGSACVVMVGVAAVCLLWPRFWGGSGLDIRRFATDQALYGLTLGDLLTPPRSIMARLRQAYGDYLSVRGDTREGTDAFVGWPGLAGLAISAVLLLGAPLRQRRHVSAPALAAILMIVLVVFSVRHGLGELFNTFVTPEIRAQNRVAPMIAFLALYVFAAASGRRWQSVVVIVAALGLWDQTAGIDYGAWQNDPGLGQRWSDAKADAAAVETALPTGATILQLPLMPYPEGVPVQGVESYAQMNLALFTKGYHYSFGSAGDALRYGSVQAFLDPVSPILAVVDAAAYGYDEILFYRAGYADGGASTRQAIEGATGRAPNIDAPDVFGFDLRPLREGAPAVTSAAHKTWIGWEGRGFSIYEHAPDFDFRWDDSADAEAAVVVDNPSAGPVAMRFCGTVVPSSPGTYPVTINAAGRVLHPPTDPTGVPVNVTFDAPPGRSTLSVAMPVPRLTTEAGDPRHIHFQLREPVLQPVAVLDGVRTIAERLGIALPAGCPSTAPPS